ncbi:hypothetical protein H6G86_04855 [Nostoc sp. FACHB-133]|nr:hypothetical protein [Nostoc sp. FACHB-133]
MSSDGVAGGCVTVGQGFGTSDCKTDTPKLFSWDKSSNTVSAKGFKMGGTEEVTAGLLVLARVCALLFGQTQIECRRIMSYF